MKSLAALQSNLAKARRDLQKFTDSLPRIIGVEATKIVKNNFLLAGYDSGNGISKWPARKASTNAAYSRGRSGKGGRNSTYKGSVYSARKPLLRQTLALYNSIHYVARRRSVFVGVDLTLVPYAIAHNQGLNHQPKRQFMPYGNQPGNVKIIGVIRKRIDYETNKIMTNFRR